MAGGKPEQGDVGLGNEESKEWFVGNGSAGCNRKRLRPKLTRMDQPMMMQKQGCGGGAPEVSLEEEKEKM